MIDNDAAMAEAIKLHLSGDESGAAELCEKVLANDPDNIRALNVSAIAMFNDGDAEGAILRLKKATELMPSNSGTLNNLANIYRQAGRREEAFDTYAAAVKLDPKNIEALCNLGSLHMSLGNPTLATEVLEYALTLVPQHPETNHNLALAYTVLNEVDKAMKCIEVCYADGPQKLFRPSFHARMLANSGRKARAIEILEEHLQAMPDDVITAHELAALRGEDAERCPDDYVRDTFDSFAESFDSTLAQLNYQAPQQVAEVVGGLCRGQKVPLMVDLGCGTGLVGPLVRDYCEQLIGVDLSTKMMQYAGKREVYDQLVCGDLSKFLQTIPPSSVQLALSADTLCYFGALDSVFAGLARALCKGGAFVATVESTDKGGDYTLHESGRFMHRQEYVQSCAQALGLKTRVFYDTILRLEFGKPVSGFVFVLENVGI